MPFILTHYMDVVDPKTMQPVPRDGATIGEIVMRGKNVMLGYYTPVTHRDQGGDFPALRMKMPPLAH